MTNIPVKDEASQYTDAQWQSIYQEGNNLLISASAGSGKTTVLIQRVLEKVKQGINVDELLIVTFTKAAAKEMKERLLKEVRQKIATETNHEKKQHLIFQLSLIPTANISTIDAFCQFIISKYFYLIDLDPTFRLMTDSTEIRLLKEKVWESLRENLYGEDQEAFYQLTENFSGDRGDERLTNMIFELHLFAMANPDPMAWLEKSMAQYEVTDGLETTPVYQNNKPSMVQMLEEVIHDYDVAISLGENLQNEKLLTLLQNEKQQALRLLELLQQDVLDEVYESFEHLAFPSFPIMRNLEEAELEVKEQVKELRDHNKDILNQKLKGFFISSPSESLEVLKASKTILEELVKVTRLFIEEFEKVKKKRGVLEFNDLEHFALKILRQKNPETSDWVPSDASDYFRSQFKEVMIDEYQDVNPLQEEILHWVCQPETEKGNLFMVGDVKQSIYAFRLADPTLFIEKYNQYKNSDEGQRIVLAENFRSRKNVLDFTNLVFSQIMDEKVGQIPYDDAAMLINGFTAFPAENNYDTEILLYESENETSEEDQEISEFEIEGKSAGEIMMVALKIKAMIQTGWLVYDKKQKASRPVEYSDIVLLSSTRSSYGDIQDIFKQLEIPVEINGAASYFQRAEIKIMLAVLQIIDNPYQDIPFASVLRSPIVGLKENELVAIRKGKMQGSYYESFLKFIDQEVGEMHYAPEFLTKIQAFHQQLIQWREFASQESLAKLIWRIYEDTGFLDYVGGLMMGKQRQANLQAFYQRGESYEEMGYKGLFQFIRFIEKMQQKSEDLAEPVTLDENENCVRVMTIHGSKGLEFPVVFVLNMTRQLNLPELKQDYLLDSKEGIGIKYLDSDTRIRYDSLPFLTLRESKKRKSYAEEMRKLYVALTRAEQKLFLVGSYKNQGVWQKKWRQAANQQNLILNENSRLEDSRSFMDWIGMALMRHPDINAVFPEIPYHKISAIINHPAHFSVEWQNEETLSELFYNSKIESLPVKKENLSSEETLVSVDGEVREAVALLDFQYPYQQATLTTSFQSVSELKRVFEDPEQNELKRIDLDVMGKSQANRYTSSLLSRPNFMENKKSGIAATEIGTAVHLLMQLLPLDEEVSLTRLETFIETLVTDSLISKEVAEKIPVEQIFNFFKTDFGMYLLAHHHEVHREQAFSMLLMAQDIFAGYPKDAEDEILVHGMIDGYIQLPDKVVLYDFKTDYLPDDTEKSIQQMISKYRGQLYLYKKALTQVLEKPVDETYLILLSVNRAIKL